MNPSAATLALPTNHERVALANEAVAAVGALVTNGLNAYPLETRQRLHELLSADASIVVTFTLGAGVVIISATLEHVELFRVTLGSGSKEAAVH